MTRRSLHTYTSEIEPMILFSNYPRRVEDYLEYCRRYFTAMQQLGATIFVLHRNKIPAASLNAALYFERFQCLSELGESFGIQIAQENVARCTSASLAFLTQMRDALRKQAHFVLDVKQAVRAGESPMAMLQALGSHVVHVHISDHGEYSDCLPIGKGRFQVNAFLQQLVRVSPDCSVILELYLSGFSDLPVLVSNYTLLQNRIHAAEKGANGDALSVLR
ncbi:MAG: sugar phosphate isomerase/epimerase [Ruminococcus sp.]|nr:sugar phosphate isomerase/epimerase [Ruminococcus sp.]